MGVWRAHGLRDSTNARVDPKPRAVAALLRVHTLNAASLQEQPICLRAGYVAYDLVATRGGMTLMVELLVPTEWCTAAARRFRTRLSPWDCEKSPLPALNAWQADAVYNVRASKRSVVNTCRAGSGSLPPPPSRSTQEPVGIGVTCLAPCSSMQLDSDLGE